MINSYITVTRLYTGSDQESHFEEISVPLKTSGGLGSLSQNVSTTGMIFRTMPGDYQMNWHTTKTRQYVVIISGGVEIEVKSGEKRFFKQGDIILSEDKTGRGHRSRSIDGQERVSLFITLE